MANYNKSFNFRNGVQVDTDKFIVNTAGLVGIGSTLPTNYLDVQGGASVTGDIKVSGGDVTVTGLVTSSQLYVSGLSTFFGNIGIGTTNADKSADPNNNTILNTGIVTANFYYGSGLYLDDIVGFATESWNVVRASGASADRTGLTTTAKVGIGTTEANNLYDLIIGSNPVSGEGISFNGSTGYIRSSGTIKADYFDGDGVNAGILTGTIAAASHEQPNITSLGDLTTLTVLGNAGIGSINVSGVSTFTGISTFSSNVSFGSSVLFGDNDKILLGYGNDVEIYHTGSDSIIKNTTGQLAMRSPQWGVQGSGSEGYNIYCVAGAQIQLYYAGNERLKTTNEGVYITGLTSTTNLDVSGVGSFGSIGIGTTTPTVDFQLRREAANTDAILQVISEKKTAIVAVGDSESLTGHTGQFRYGQTSGFTYSDEISLDIINYSRGSINNILNPSLQTGIGTGNFNWLVGSSVDPEMTLTYEGNLGIGITLPEHNLHVGGSSTVGGDAYVKGTLEVDGGLTINGTLSFTSALEANLNGDILAPNGSTVLFNTGTGDGSNSELKVGIFTATTSIETTGTAEVSRLGIGTLPNNGDLPLKINPDPSNRVYVHTSGWVGIKTDQIYDNIDVAIPHSDIFLGGKLGIGNSAPFCALDVGTGGTATTRYMRPPQVTDGERVGLVTTLGALVYNLTSNTFQVYTGDSTGWKTVTAS